MISFEENQTSIHCNYKRMTFTHTKRKYSCKEEDQLAKRSLWKGVIKLLSGLLFLYFPTNIIYIVFPSSDCCIKQPSETSILDSEISKTISDPSPHQPDKHISIVFKESKPLTNGMTEEDLLIQAIKNEKDMKARELIIDVGVNVSYQDENGDSPLHIASSKGNQNIIDLLLDNGASMVVQNNAGNTPLHILVKEGHYDIISELRFLNDRDMECIASISNIEGNTASDLAYANMINEPHFQRGVIDDLASMKCDFAQLE